MSTLINSCQNFSVYGLPFISENFKGDHYSSIRYTIRKWIQREFGCTNETIKRIFVNMETKDVQFTVTGTTRGDELKKLIRECPSGEICFSWDNIITEGTKNKYSTKSIMFLPEMYPSYSALKTNRDLVMSLYQEQDMKIVDEYNKQMAFECEMEKFATECEIDDILSEGYDENIEQMVSLLKDDGIKIVDEYNKQMAFECEMEKFATECEIDDILSEGYDENIEQMVSLFSQVSVKTKNINDYLVLNSDDLDVEPTSDSVKLVETFSTDKTFTPQEICEKIRFMNVCGIIKISEEDMNKMVHAFGERRTIE